MSQYINYKQLFLLSILSFSATILTGCREKANFTQDENSELQIVNKQELWADRRISLSLLNKIGSDKVEDDQYLFARISDLAVDKNDNLYALDLNLMRVSKFNPQGRILSIIKLISGHGPGEFIRPRELAISLDGNLLISDDSRRKIVVLDSLGTCIKEFSVKMHVSALGVDRNDYIYLVGFLFSYSGSIIQEYDAHFSYVTSFCKRYPYEKDYNLTGFTGKVFINKQNKIYYSFEYPYEIRAFMADGTMMQRFGRDLSCYKPPIKDKKNNVVYAKASAVAVCELPGDLLLNLYRCDINGKWHFYFDLFDQNQNFLKTVCLDDFGIDFVRNFCVDSSANFYMDSIEPYPHISKYKLEIKRP